MTIFQKDFVFVALLTFMSYALSSLALPIDESKAELLQAKEQIVKLINYREHHNTDRVFMIRIANDLGKIADHRKILDVENMYEKFNLPSNKNITNSVTLKYSPMPRNIYRSDNNNIETMSSIKLYFMLGILNGEEFRFNAKMPEFFIVAYEKRSIASHIYREWVNVYSWKSLYPYPYDVPRFSTTFPRKILSNTKIDNYFSTKLSEAAIISKDKDFFWALEVHYSSDEEQIGKPIFKCKSKYSLINGTKIEEIDAIGKKEKEYHHLWPVHKLNSD